MFALFLSAIYSGLSFILRSIVIKLFIMFSLFFVVKSFIPVLNDFLAKSINVDIIGYFNSLPSDIWFFLNYFQLPLGFNIATSAWLVRFVIKRIPLIG